MNLYNKEHFAGIDCGGRSNRGWLRACGIKDKGEFYKGCLAIGHAVRRDDVKNFNSIFIPKLLDLADQFKSLRVEPCSNKLDALVLNIEDIAANLLGVTAFLNHASKTPGCAGQPAHLGREMLAYAICHIIGLTQIPG